MLRPLLLGTMLLLGAFPLFAQETVELRNAQVIPMTFLGETQAYRDWDPEQSFPDPIVRNMQGLQIPHDELENKGLHKKTNPKALPLDGDPVWQAVNGSRSNGQRALDLSQDGMGFQNLNPADPCLDVGPNHVIQMINGGSGSYFQVFNKQGGSLGPPVYLDNFTGSVGGAGDPIVLYDGLADRWMMSEFAASGNRLLVAVSSTPDPTGTWYAYEFVTPNFPDYPKYSIWNSMYMVTTNEGTGCPIYCLDRTSMLAGGTAATAQRFTTPDYPSIGFQATTPITVDGSTPPPANAPAMLMRMADDGWTAAIPNDRLELWTLSVDFANSANSVLTGPSYLAVSPFDTELCGYTSFSCIDQPGTSTNLDPLREVIMNRAQYRNFGTHESIVCNHVTDVSGSDQAGVRWYELRRTGGVGQPWVVYQEGTYAPDANSRWMAAISMNAAGDIGLSYSVSSGTTYPSLRYTGRSASDALGVMTIAETSIVAGTTYNASNRWGDYFSLDTDPADGSFWGTGCYNTTTSWKTRIFQFTVPSSAPNYTLGVTSTSATACQPANATYSVQVGSVAGYSSPVTLSVSGLAPGLNVAFSTNPVTPAGTSTLTIGNTGGVATGTYNFTLNASSIAGPQSIPLTLEVLGTPAAVTLASPANGATGHSGALSWNAVTGAATYTVQIASDAGMTNVLETGTGITGTSYTPTVANQPTTTYYWRVRAVNACGNGAYSSIRSYTTATCQNVAVKITLDRYGTETTWTVEDGNGTVYASGGPYTNAASNGAYPQADAIVCLPPGCYELVVLDSFGDGLCCAYGNGYIAVTEINGPPLSGAVSTFTFTGIAPFCVGNCVSTLPYSENFDGGTGAWYQSFEDDMDWTRLSGATPSSNTGPTGDHTTGSGFYMYTEASNPNSPNKEAILYGPCVDLSGLGTADMTFWFNMFGANMGTLNVDIWNGSSWTLGAFTLTGNQGTAWQQGSVDLDGFVGSIIRPRFRGITGSGFASDMAIDDIQITGAAPAAVRLSIDLFLEGPYNSGTALMSDVLRTSGLLPTTEPYSAAGYVFAGGGGGETIAPAVLTVSGNNAIVDWVVVELRSSSDNSSVLASRSALVQRDGDVVDLDGVSDVGISVPPGNYFVAVRHRNHLGVMATPALALSSIATVVDLRSAATTVYGVAARKAIGSARVLWAGDVTFNGQLKYTGAGNDRDPILSIIGGTVPTATTTGYHREDVDMNGTVRYTGSGNDRDPILQNVGGIVPTATRAEQLP